MNTRFFSHGLRLLAVFTLLLAALAPAQFARADGTTSVTLTAIGGGAYGESGYWRPTSCATGTMYNHEAHFALEFDLSTIPSGATINSAVLWMRVRNSSAARAIAIREYVGNGSIEMDDMEVRSSAILFFTPTISTDREGHNVTSSIVTRVSNGNRWAGFLMLQQPLIPITGYVLWDCPNDTFYPQLVIEYTPPAATTTSLASSTTPSIFGEAVTFTAAISPAPTGGTAAFKDNGVIIAGCEAQPLIAGQANCTTSTLVAGMHDITAEYSGASGYSGSTGAFSQEVSCASAITVTNADDSGAGSLRQAIANVCADGTITFDDDYTIPLASTLTIDRDMTIDGAGHSIMVSGNHSVRVFWVYAGVALNLQNLTVANASSGDGGGIYNRGTLNLTNVMLRDNVSSGKGGAIYNTGWSASTSLTNATFSGNSATGGGAIYNYTGALNSTNVTISGNSASGQGGGIYDYAGNLSLTNTIVSGNLGYGDVWCDHTDSGSASGQNNLIASWRGASCDVAHSSADPLLGPLADNGGPTQTFALLPGSAAIDAANDAACPAVDQRSVARPQGAHCDIGA